MIKPLCPECEAELVKCTGYRYVMWSCPACPFAEFDMFMTKAA